MIKINLLPTKKKPPKKVIDLQQQLLLAFLVLILLGIGTGYFWMKQNSRIESLKKQQAEADAKIRAQDEMLKEVKNVEEERARVAEKISVIERLKKNQEGPVRLLDEISSALPKSVNILALAENNNNVNLEGESFTNEDVVRFVDNLKASRLLTGVTLLETVQAKRDGLDIYKYKLLFVYKGL